VPKLQDESLANARKGVQAPKLVLRPHVLNPETGEWRDAKEDAPGLQDFTVLKQFPDPGTWVPPETAVTCYLMRPPGPPLVKVPKLVTQPGDKARAALGRDFRFDPRVPGKGNEWVPFEKFDDRSLQVYTVVQQHPEADTWVLPGTAVTCDLRPSKEPR
jgi:hypothetical protein